MKTQVENVKWPANVFEVNFGATSKYVEILSEIITVNCGKLMDIECRIDRGFGKPRKLTSRGGKA